MHLKSLNLYLQNQTVVQLKYNIIIMNLDLELTSLIYNVVNGNSFTKQIPYYFGLLPYEFYVLPGMFIAMVQVIVLSAYSPIQFHLLPHFFAFSLFQLIKNSFGRERPGCANKLLSNFIDDSHCLGKQRFMSFPSGHTGIAFALAIALYMEMNYSKDPKFFEIKIKQKKYRNVISLIGLFVAFNISIHRISKGYHYASDTIIGALLGGAIGYITWTVLEKYKTKFKDDCNPSQSSERVDETKSKIWLTGAKFVLLIPILYLFLKFFVIDFANLSSIKH